MENAPLLVIENISIKRWFILFHISFNGHLPYLKIRKNLFLNHSDIFIPPPSSLPLHDDSIYSGKNQMNHMLRILTTFCGFLTNWNEILTFLIKMKQFGNIKTWIICDIFFQKHQFCFTRWVAGILSIELRKFPLRFI